MLCFVVVCVCGGGGCLDLLESAQSFSHLQKQNQLPGTASKGSLAHNYSFFSRVFTCGNYKPQNQQNLN